MIVNGQGIGASTIAENNVVREDLRRQQNVKVIGDAAR
jgi:hypothetical protein